VAAGPTSGRKRSVALLFASICLQIAFQFGVAPVLGGKNDLNYTLEAWTDGCTQFDDNNDDDDNLLFESCTGNYANYRVACATTLFFALAAVAAACKPTANREAWPAKFILWLFLVAGFCFVPNEPLFSDVYLNVARGACSVCVVPYCTTFFFVVSLGIDWISHFAYNIYWFLLICIQMMAWQSEPCCSSCFNSW